MNIIWRLINSPKNMESDHDTFCILHLKKNGIMSWLLCWIAVMFAYIGLISQLSVFHGPILVGSLIEVFKLFKPFHTEYIGFSGFITFSLGPPYTYRSQVESVCYLLLCYYLWKNTKYLNMSFPFQFIILNIYSKRLIEFIFHFLHHFLSLVPEKKK